MAKVTIELGGTEYKYKSKKAMLQQVGASILKDEEHPMTVRQLYYRFVAADLIENKESQYQYLCEAIKEARLDGLVPWDAIEDRTRSSAAGDYNRVSPDSRLEHALEYAESTAERHHRPLWERQSNYVEVWVEKEALSAVFERVADELGVVSLPCRGYPSITTLRDAAERLKAASGRNRHIVYFGDHDPSGQDIERHVKETLQDTFGVDVSVKRAALDREQIEEHELPPQPAKRSDSRFEDFVAEHGDMAVELDALPPDELRSLIQESVKDLYDEDVYAEHVKPRRDKERDYIEGVVDKAVADGWEDLLGNGA